MYKTVNESKILSLLLMDANGGQESQTGKTYNCAHYKFLDNNRKSNLKSIICRICSVKIKNLKTIAFTSLHKI